MRVILFAVVAFGSLISLEAHDNRSNGSNTIRVDEALIVFLVGSAFCALAAAERAGQHFVNPSSKLLVVLCAACDGNLSLAYALTSQ